MAVKCPQCRKPIPFEATSHVCGWNASGTLPGVETPAPRPHVYCHTYQCPDNATVRVYTALGWINVCPKCYGSTERALRPSTSQAVKEIRAAYLKRNAPAADCEIRERIPGEDDDLPGKDGHLQLAADALEAEFAANPGATPYRAGKARASRT